MVITITNADKNLIKIIESINEKLTKPYEIVKDEEIPTDETRKAIRDCAKGKGKAYKNFAAYMQEIDNA